MEGSILELSDLLKRNIDLNALEASDQGSGAFDMIELCLEWDPH